VVPGILETKATQEEFMSKEELEAAALSLSPGERASLAHKLIASIDHDPTGEIEEAWLREVDRRAEDVTKGEVDLVQGDEVFRKAFARRHKE
jgi:putative addiction module component (TIGR02574 family)